MKGKVNPVDIHVGHRVRIRRKFLGMSQEHLAGHLDVTFQQIQKYELGANRISASKLYEIGQALSVPVKYFFEGFGDTDTENSSISVAEEDIMLFLATAEGIELAQLFPRIKNPAQRRQILSLVVSIADASLRAD